MITRRYTVYLFCVLFILNGCSKKFLFEEEKKDIKNLIKLYENTNWEKRKEAVTKICAYKIPEATDLLITAIDDIHSIIRIEAIKCLGSRKEQKARKNIKMIAEFENDPNVKLAAIQALANYRDPSAAPVFAKGLVDDDWLIREESIRGLLMINDVFIRQVSTPYILEALKDQRINVRLATLDNLKIKNQKLFAALSEIINDEKNYYKIRLLRSALKAINGYLLNRKTRERLIEYLTHPNKEIRILSLNILKKDNELQAQIENE